jgi:serine-type D-Ala-D-Ala carboxypeptidase (penicillin-binding protein 5/6)
VRGRRTLFGLGLLVLVVAILLVALAPKANSPNAPRRALLQPKVSSTPAKSPPVLPFVASSPAWSLKPAPAAEQVSPRLAKKLRSGLLFDVRTGAILWQLHPDRVLPIASLTKMMTALVVIAHSHPGDRVLVTRDAIRFAGSGIGLLPLGKRVPLLPLLYGLLLPSGNDAAIALAEHVAGTQTRFIAMMNAAARQLGLGCSHFTTVSGIVDRGNYSCVKDLAVLAHTVLEERLLARIVGSRSAVLPFPIKGGKLFLYNNNPLLVERFPGADGVKTGYTSASGPCLVATARRGRAWLGVVLLNSSDEITQAGKLLGAGFAKLGRRTGHAHGGGTRT